METGRAFGEDVRTRFPGGVLIEATEPEAALEETRRALESGADTLFEPAFLADGLYVRCDVLLREGTAWRLVEVKSSTSVKPHYEEEVAFQVEVLRRAGIEVVRASLGLVDKTLVRGDRPLEHADLLLLTDLTRRVDQLRTAVLDAIRTWEGLREAGRRPDAVLGPACRNPVPCPFTAHCREGQSETDIETIPGMRHDRIVRFRAQGVDTIEQIPDGERLSPIERRVVEVVRFGGPRVEPGVAGELASIEFPACFVDFEAAGPLLPLFPGLGPYGPVVFQWSCHRLDSPGSEAVHSEFLDVTGQDPRSGFVASLRLAVEGARSIAVYSSYEKQRLEALERQGIDGAKDLLGYVLDRLVDLYPIVREGVYDRAFGGQFSIKAVLPALVPGLDYSDLAIKGGDAASQAYLDLVSGALPPEAAEATREALLRYCERDTLAMVELYRALRRLARLD